MPFTIIIKNKTVIINNDTKSIMAAFLQALKNHKIEISQLPPGENRVRKGLWSIVAKVETFTDKTLSAKESNLDRIEIELDPPAKFLRDEYILFLNQLAKEDGAKSDQITSEKIDSIPVLIREILLRLASDALSVNMNGDHDGERLLSVMQDFIEQIQQKNRLLTKGIIISKLTAFSRGLATSHQAWLDLMHRMILAVKLLHENKTVITDTLNLLEKTRLVILRQLAAELSSESGTKTLKEARLHGDFIADSIAGLENQLIDKIPKNERRELVVAGKSTQTQRREGVLAVIKQSEKETTPSMLKVNTAKRINVRELYQFLDRTTLLLEIVCQLDALNTTTGWVAIMTGAIKLDVVASLMRDHASQCRTLLRVDEDAAILHNTKLFPFLSLPSSRDITLALIRFDAATGHKLESLAFKTAKGLEHLQSPETLGMILQYIKSTIHQLLNLQKQLPPGCELVDRKVCGELIDNYLTERVATISAANSPASVSSQKPSATLLLVGQSSDPNKLLVAADAGKHEAIRQSEAQKPATSLPVISVELQPGERNQNASVPFSSEKITLPNVINLSSANRTIVLMLIHSEEGLRNCFQSLRVDAEIYSDCFNFYSRTYTSLLQNRPQEALAMRSAVRLARDESWATELIQRSPTSSQTFAGYFPFNLARLLNGQFQYKGKLHSLANCPIFGLLMVFNRISYLKFLQSLNPSQREKYAAIVESRLHECVNQFNLAQEDAQALTSGLAKIDKPESLQHDCEHITKRLENVITFLKEQLWLLRGEYRSKSSQTYNLDNCPPETLQRIFQDRYILRQFSDLSPENQQVLLDFLNEFIRSIVLTSGEISAQTLFAIHILQRISDIRRIESLIDRIPSFISQLWQDNNEDNKIIRERLLNFFTRYNIAQDTGNNRNAMWQHEEKPKADPPAPVAAKQAKK